MGASANIWKVIEFALVVFIFPGVILTVHLLFMLLASKLLNL
ncbi:MAG: hypothetical protein J7F05_04615 [Trichodesmium erythraeum GBRTRLIN201]|nr:hypothetical protein [Trichodesmium erythraeum GBRTRLIN201]